MKKGLKFYGQNETGYGKSTALCIICAQIVMFSPDMSCIYIACNTLGALNAASFIENLSGLKPKLVLFQEHCTHNSNVIITTPGMLKEVLRPSNLKLICIDDCDMVLSFKYVQEFISKNSDVTSMFTSTVNNLEVKKLNPISFESQDGIQLNEKTTHLYMVLEESDCFETVFNVIKDFDEKCTTVFTKVKIHWKVS